MNKLLALSSTLLLSLTLATPTFARGRNFSFTGGGGRNLSVNNYTNRTGSGTYSRYGNYTGTGTGGGTRSGTYSGMGTYGRTSEGRYSNYTGTVNANNGNTYNVGQESKTTNLGNGSYERVGGTTITDSNGNLVRGRSTDSSYNSATGLDRTTTNTTKNGQTYTTNATVVKDPTGGYDKTTTTTNSAGQVVGGSTQDIGYAYTPGQGWTKTVTGTRNNGQAINRTITSTPIPNPAPIPETP